MYSTASARSTLFLLCFSRAQCFCAAKRPLMTPRPLPELCFAPPALYPNLHTVLCHALMHSCPWTMDNCFCVMVDTQVPIASGSLLGNPERRWALLCRVHSIECTWSALLWQQRLSCS